MWKINPISISKKPFDISRFKFKVIDKIQGEVGMDIFFDIFKHLL